MNGEGLSDFDHSARYAYRNLDSAGLLRWLLGEKFWSAWRWTGWEDSQAAPTAGERGLRADTVAIFERQAGDHGPLLVVLEFLAEARRDVLGRVVGYSMHFRDNVFYQRGPDVPYDVIGIVVNLKGRLESGRWQQSERSERTLDHCPRRRAPPDCPETLDSKENDPAAATTDTGAASVPGLGLWLSAGVVNLEERDARTTLAAIEAGTVTRSVLAFVSLMAGANAAEVVAWWRRLAEQETDERMRGDYAGSALLFADHAGCLDVWKKGLEGFNMERSKVILEWEARGRLITLRETVLETLQIRFKQTPEDLARAIEQQDNPAVLKHWHQLAVTAASFEEMRSQMGNGTEQAG